MTTGKRSLMWLFFCLLALSTGRLNAQASYLQPPEKPQGKKDGDDLRKLLKERYATARAEIAEQTRQMKFARFDVNEFLGASQRLLRSGLELFDDPKDRVAFLSKHVKTLKSMEESMQARVNAGRGKMIDLFRVRYDRLDAEIHLLRAKREPDKAKGK